VARGRGGRRADGGNEPGDRAYGDVNCSAAARAVTFVYGGFVSGSPRVGETFASHAIYLSYAKLPSDHCLACVLTWC
jgi:hypothetical protein